jgi:hypothetical protein
MLKRNDMLPSPPDGPSSAPSLGFLERFRALRAREKESQAMLANLQALFKQGHFRCTKVEGIEAERITDPAYAPELSTRHEQLYIADRVAQKVLESDGDADKLKPLAKELKSGGFLHNKKQGYGIEDMRKRILDPRWVIAHAKGSIVDSTTAAMLPPKYASDVHIHLAEDRIDAPLLTFVPDPEKEVHLFHEHRKQEAIDVAKMIHDNHAVHAVIEDVSVEREYQEKGFGNAVERFAFQVIEDEINRTRAHAVQVFLASMFSIKKVKDGKREVTLPIPMQNVNSLFMHGLRDDPNHMLAWTSPTTDIPVEIPVGDGNDLKEVILTAGWETAAILRRTKRA